MESVKVKKGEGLTEILEHLRDEVKEGLEKPAIKPIKAYSKPANFLFMQQSKKQKKKSLEKIWTEEDIEKSLRE